MWMMYWLVKLDDVRVFFITGSTVTGVLLGITLIPTLMCSAEVLSYPSNSKSERAFLATVKKHYKKGVLLLLSFLLPAFLIPSTKQMAAIIIVPKLYNGLTENEGLKELPDNLVELANDWIETLKPQAETAEKETIDGH
jgi:hypothetical protein